MLPGRVNYIALDDQVVAKKLCRIGVVGMNTANMCGGKINLVYRVRAEPFTDRMLIGQVKLGTARDNRLNAVYSKTTANRGTDQPVMAGNKYFAHDAGTLLVIVKGLVAGTFN